MLKKPRTDDKMNHFKALGNFIVFKLMSLRFFSYLMKMYTTSVFFTNKGERQDKKRKGELERL